MMQKGIVKADPDVLGEFCLGLLARFLIRIMHKVLFSLIILWNITISMIILVVHDVEEL